MSLVKELRRTHINAIRIALQWHIRKKSIHSTNRVFSSLLTVVSIHICSPVNDHTLMALKSPEDLGFTQCNGPPLHIVYLIMLTNGLNSCFKHFKHKMCSRLGQMPVMMSHPNPNLHEGFLPKYKPD